MECVSAKDPLDESNPRVEAEVPPPVVAWEGLDPRAIGLWRISGVITALVVLAVALVPALAVGWGALGRPGVSLGLWGTVVVLWGVWLWRYPPRRFAAWGYRVDAQVLELRFGVWFHVHTLLPLSRVQHVDLQRGPLERSKGLASLVLHTAGTHEATLVIPGLDADVAARLRDRLVAVEGDDGV